jgi:hypothetical protein
LRIVLVDFVEPTEERYVALHDAALARSRG